ncbi:pentatricopeptide repeat-containing protein, mitochondrial-like protein [Salvia divinorum]|uniref:Pentatricopeptide repeat-containing protein, mitochondrial-like protein n=1 Tax=Salvia divinorum TaxID=28513 RepID=A0ABD1GS95_SALDI
MHYRFVSTSSSATSQLHTKIKNLISQESYEEALTFYARHLHPSQLTIDTAFLVPSITKACAHSQSHRILGRQLHCNVVKLGFDSDFTVSNSLLSMYAKFSDTERAEKVFDEMPERDTISWNSMINCYIQNGNFSKALNVVKEMYGLGLTLKPELAAGCIAACARNGSWRLGRAIHALFLTDERMEFSMFVATALVDFYWRFGDPEMAFRVFGGILERNQVSWTAMITGCVEFRDYGRAFDCVRAMQLGGVKPNRVTLVSVLPACAALRSITHGKEVHGYAARRGYDSDGRLSAALLHVYCESPGGLRIAWLVFDRSVNKEVVMWSTMIAGFSRSKATAREGIELFNRLQINGILPNNATILAVISSCVSLLSLPNGSGIHGYALKSGLGSDLFVQNALISMYSKCGSLGDCLRVFNEMATRDCVSWSSLITAYGMHGHAGEALQLFDEMQREQVKADGAAYLAALSACSHGGLVEEGRAVFERAMGDVEVSMGLEHYGCYIDLLGRAGEVEEAYDVVGRMAMEPSPGILSSLVTACRVYGRLDVGERVGNMLVEMEPENAANHTLLSMVYAESDKWWGVEEVRRGMRRRRLRKKSSFSKV